MITGNGLLARAFEKHYGRSKGIEIFASGVSNSSEQRMQEFERERRLLSERLASGTGKFVYFGSCAVGNPLESVTPYLKHKSEMETLVRSSRRGLVLRLPQVAGHSSNPNTLINFICHHLSTGKQFKVWSRAERNLIDVDDLVSIAQLLIDEHWGVHEVISIAALNSTPMPDIVKLFEEALGVKGNYLTEDKGAPFPIDTTGIVPLARQLGIDLGDGYINKVISKYGLAYKDRRSDA